jgi:hypothetical protein
MENTTVKFDSGGLLIVLLTSIFAAAKVFGFITWSWLWVLSPIWISIGFVLSLLAICGLVMLFIVILNKIAGW